MSATCSHQQSHERNRSLFQAMAPTLIANVLTVVFVYCFAVIDVQERKRDEERER